MWADGIVGLKRILGVRSREEVLRIMDKLQELAYIFYTLNPSTKKLEYRILDWVIQCSGAECMSGQVYTCVGIARTVIRTAEVITEHSHITKQRMLLAHGFHGTQNTKEIYYEQDIGKYRKSGQRARAEDQCA